jgi:hypothetical protein
MAQTGRSNVRYVDPQRRYTLVLDPIMERPFSKRCPTTTALERTIVPMDDAKRMPPLGTVKLRQKFVDVIHRAQLVAPWNSGTSAARLVTGILGGRPNSEVPFWSALGACCSAGFWLG